MSIILTVTSEDQVILGKEVLKQLGVRAGDQLEVEARPVSHASAGVPAGNPVSSIFGLLKDDAIPALTIEEINEAAAAGWSGER